MATTTSSSNTFALRHITDAQVDAVRQSDCTVLPVVIAQPSLVLRAPTTTRQAFLSALLQLIGDSRSTFTGGVKKESAVAMRCFVAILSSAPSVEGATETRALIRQFGLDEFKKLKLERHLMSAKEDVGPAAVDFGMWTAQLFRTEPSEFISGTQAAGKVEEALRQRRSSIAAQQQQQGNAAAPQSGGSNSGGGSAPPAAANGSAPPPGQQQQQPSQRTRGLPAKPSSTPHAANPMHQEGAPMGLMPIYSPTPVLSFAKHFGLGCIPRIPKLVDGGSLVLAAPQLRRGSEKGGGPAGSGTATDVTATGASSTSGDSAPPLPQPSTPPPLPTATASTPPPLARETLVVPSGPPAAASLPAAPTTRPVMPPPPQSRVVEGSTTPVTGAAASASGLGSRRPSSALMTTPPPVVPPPPLPAAAAAAASTTPTDPSSPEHSATRRASMPAAPSSPPQLQRRQSEVVGGSLEGSPRQQQQQQQQQQRPSIVPPPHAAIASSSSDPDGFNNEPVPLRGNSFAMGALAPPPLARTVSALGASTVSLGMDQSAALLKRYLSSPDGVLVGWGGNRNGELGTCNALLTATPKVIAVPNGGKVVHIACGAQYSIWLTANSQLYSCGAAEWGQLGLGDPSKLHEVSDGVPVATSPMLMKNFKPNDVLADATAGYAFAVSTTEQGELYLWGNNNHGQCNVGTELRSDNIRVCNPLKVGLRATKVVSVACGSFFVVILTATGSVLSWGLAQLLGIGTEEDVLRVMDRKWVAESLSKEKRHVILCPCKVSSLDGKGVKQLCAGQWHALAVTADGAVFSWGVGHQGRLGHGGVAQETRPRRIEGLHEVMAIEARCGSFHSAILAHDGRVFVFGDNASGQCGIAGQPFYLSPVAIPLPSAAIAIGCGRENTTMLLADGDIFVCGSGTATGVGFGWGSKLLGPQRICSNFISLSLHCGVNHTFALAVPRVLELVPIGTLHSGPPSKITSMLLKDGLISAALGSSFTAVVNRNGETFSFGNGDWGQLGLGSIAQLLERSPVADMPVVVHPQRIAALSKVKVAAVAAGYAFATCLTETQKVYFWGNNNHSQGGLGVEARSRLKVEEPAEVTLLSDKGVVQIACGSFFVLALTAGGEVYSWGIMDCCGHDRDPVDIPRSHVTTSATAEERPVLAVPTKIAALQGVVHVAAGQWHALALTDKGHLFAWGVGHQGRLGTGDTMTRATPTKLQLLAPIVSIGCGSFNSWALTAGSDLYMWGDNDSKQCGQVEADTLLVPTKVASHVRSASSGRQHTVIVTNEGKVLVSGALTHHDKLYQSKGFDPAQQPPPVQQLWNSNRFALQVFSGPHHSLILVERERPNAVTVTAASNELRTNRGKAASASAAGGSRGTPRGSETSSTTDLRSPISVPHR